MKRELKETGNIIITGFKEIRFLHLIGIFIFSCVASSILYNMSIHGIPLNTIVGCGMIITGVMLALIMAIDHCKHA